MPDRHYFTDTATATLSYAGEGTLTTDDFDPSEAETATRDGPWTDFFDTDEYVQFEATVAQPIVQPYVHDGDLRTFKKDETELREAQAQLDNLPWTMGHPPQERVTTTDQIRGFWENPRWSDGQQATLNIPADDTEAVRYAVHNEEVSVGFSGTLDWVDDESTEYDAVQRNMVYDHVASVENGRCPPEEGCGLHVDDDTITHGHSFADAVRTTATEESTSDGDFEVGDWVAFSADGADSARQNQRYSQSASQTGSGDRHHGKLVHVDDERALVKEYDEDAQRLTDQTTTVATDDLRQWVGPYADDCPGETCSCGCHVHAADDAPDGIYVEDGSWYGIAPSENSGEDGPGYPLNDCDDVQDAYNLRNNGEYQVETATLVGRIKDAAQAHDCPPEFTPWVDTATDPPTEPTQPEHMSDTLIEFLDEQDLSAEDVIDALDLEVPEEPHAFYDGEPDAESLADDFDAVDLLLDEKEDLEATIEDLEDDLHEYRKAEFADEAERLAEMTEKWGDADDLVERFEDEADEEFTSADDVTEKIELVEDIAGSETTTVADDSDDEDERDVTAIADEDEDVRTTESGKLILASKR